MPLVLVLGEFQLLRLVLVLVLVLVLGEFQLLRLVLVLVLVLVLGEFQLLVLVLVLVLDRPSTCAVCFAPALHGDHQSACAISLLCC